MHDDLDVITRAREELRRVAAPEPELERVVRRARAVRVRRAIGAAVAAAVVAAGILLPLGALGVLDHERITPRPNASPSPSEGPALDFEPSSGWNVLTSDPSLAAQPGAPLAWAANVPFDPADATPGVSQSYPGGDPSSTIQTLPAEGIVILARLPLETNNPLLADRTFPERTLPLQLDQAPFSGWEGQARENLSMSVLNATVNGWRVSVSAIFGTKDPSAALVQEAKDEVARLIVPPLSATTDAFDEFGIRMEHPTGWFGSLTEWASASPVLEASTVPIADLYDGSSARKVLGPQDLFIVLAENGAYAAHYEPVTLPISIRTQDLCPTCEINDDGTSPPAGHELYYRAFATADRQFQLWVEFGTTDVSSDDLATVNGLLATLQIDPIGPSPSPSSLPSPPPPAAVSVDLPSGWVQVQDPVPGAVDPSVVAAYGTWDFPVGGDCGPEPALQALPADGAFVWIDEYANPGNAGDFEAGAPSSIDLQTPPSRWQCAGAAPSRMYMFSEAGRYFELHVALGPDASASTVSEAEALMASFHADPAG